MKLLSEGFLWPSVFILCLFCQSIFAFPSTQRPTKETSIDSENSSKIFVDFEEVTSKSDDASKDSADSEEVTLTPDVEVISGSENQVDVVETEEEKEHEAVDFLKKYGYIAEENKEGPSSMISLEESLKKMQKFGGIPPTGKIDNATKELMKHKRCGLPDIVKSDSSFAKRFSALARWRKKKLFYSILGYPSNSYIWGNSEVDSLIETAFRDWSSVANLNFEKTSSYYSDIKIDFLSGNHGDGYQNSFDGQGGTLAHASFPETGHMHFDDDEIWADGYIREAPDMRQVATHEIGHILGLGHSSVRNAVMYPYYKYRSNFKLQTDDINGAVQLYGRKQSQNPFFTVPEVTTTTPRPTTTTPRPTTTTPRKGVWHWCYSYFK